MRAEGRSAPAAPELVARRCTTMGCTLRLFHAGPCMCHTRMSSREKRAPNRPGYAIDTGGSLRQFALRALREGPLNPSAARRAQSGSAPPPSVVQNAQNGCAAAVRSPRARLPLPQVPSLSIKDVMQQAVAER